MCGTNSFNPRCRTYTTEKANNKEDQSKLKTGATAKDGKAITESKLDPAYNNELQDGEEDDGKFRINHEFSGKGSCPHDPRHNSTAIFTGMLFPSMWPYSNRVT